MLKRLLAFMLSIVMVVSMMPVRTFAQDGDMETTGETVIASEAQASEETLPDAPEILPSGEGEIAQETRCQVTEPEFEADLQPRSSSGTCGTGVSWTLDDSGTLTISGNGTMADYSEGSPAPWFTNRVSIRKVTVDPGVTDIGNYAFYYCVNLESVTISNTVTEIGYYAFYQCISLQTIQIPEGVKRISTYGFADCTALYHVELPDSLVNIGNSAFYGCTALETIRIPDTVTAFGSSMFSGCTALKNVHLPEELKELPNNTFYGCSVLETVVIPETVTKIGGSAFYNCVNLKTIMIPQLVTYIGSSAFVNCHKLTNIDLPKNLATISDNAFAYCAALKNMEIPVGVAKIESSAFKNCTALESVTMPKGLLYIETDAFRECKSLTSVNIPDGTVSLGHRAFYGCTSLQNVTMGNTVTSVGSQVFEDCTSLSAIIFPDSLTSIGNRAFSGCSALESVQLPGYLSQLGYQSFENCTSLKKIDLPAGIKTLESNMFYGCTALEEVMLSETLESLGQSVFYNCTALKQVTRAENLKHIGGQAFYKCTSLEQLPLWEKLETIENGVFSGCTALSRIPRWDNLKNIGNSAFYGCIALEEVMLPDTLESIGESVFRRCTSLTFIEIPAGVKTVSAYAFQECTGLEEVVVQDGTEEILGAAFHSCSALTEINIPVTVKTIGESAFYNCLKLTQITFGHTSDAELSIYETAFCLSTNSGYKDVATMVLVPYAKDVHRAIQEYPWDYYGRAVSFRSHAQLPAVSITIDTHPAQAEVGLEVPFTASVDPWYATSDLIWEVENDTGKAVIDENGVLIGTKPGFVTVICKSSDDASVCDETRMEILKATAFVSSIRVRCEGDTESEVELGEQVQMIADVQPGNAMNKKITWEVENGTGTATITQNGVLTGLTCGTVTVYAIAQDGSEVVGSRVIEIMRYVTNINVMLNGREDFTQLGVEESARLTTIFTPEDANYPNGKVYIENGTGEASYSNGYLTGISAGTVTIKVVSNDSRQLTVTREIEVVGEKASYAVAGGYLYYNTVTGTIVGCDESVTSANIPAIIGNTRITAIASNAFYCRDQLTSVTIPSSVTYIGESAFYECRNITSIRFNNTGLKSIGSYAFYNCDGLIQLNLPAGLETIEDCAFHDCDGLQTLTIPEGISHIGSHAFMYLNSLQTLTIPGEYMTNGILSYDGPLETVTYTGTKILPGVMYGRQAKKVVITDSVTEIGDDAFYYMDDMEEVVIGNGVTSIGARAFYACHRLEKLTVGDHVETIGEEAFRSANALTSVTLGQRVKTIGSRAFEECENLTEVILPEGIEELGEWVFCNCLALEKLNLPASLKRVGRGCFSTDKDNGKLQLIDLSANPTKMNGQELQLTYSLPKALLADGDQKNEIYWEFHYTEEDAMAGNPYPWDIAHLDGNGMLYSHGRGVGDVTVVCRDAYSGASGSWSITISSGVVIRTDRKEDFLASGDVMQLSAWIMPGDMEADVVWSIREQDQEFASISRSGKLTARAVNAAKQIEITAQPYDGGEAATLLLWIVPRTTGLYIYDGAGDVTGQELDVDSAVYPSLQLRVVTYPEGAMADVRWETSDEDVAIVDNGLVTFNGLGSVTISVVTVDGSGKSASVRLNVRYQDSAGKLTAFVDAENDTLRCGETAQMLVYGSDPDVPLDTSLLEFGIPDSQKHIATVDADGLITAGEKAGTVTVTASLAGDPLGRRVSIKLTVQARLTERLLLHPDAQAPAQVQLLDENGNVIQNPSDVNAYAVVLKKADVEQDGYTFRIVPEAFHSDGSFHPEKADLKWASSNTKIATVAVQKDGTALVTVKKGVDGACTISAVTNDAAKAENRLLLNIKDYAPRLEDRKPVLNTYLSQAAVLNLVPSYENRITGVMLMEGGAVSSRLEAAYADGIVTIITKQTIPNSSLNLVLRVTCSDGNIYDFALSAKVKNIAPGVTVQQLEKFNLFYSDTVVPVRITAKDAEVTNVVLTDTADFVIQEYDGSTGLAYLQFSESYILEHSKSADAKASLLIYLEGYEEPVKKSFSISTTNKKPDVVLTAKSSVVNTAISKDYVTSLGFCMKGSEQLLDLSRAEVRVNAAFAEGWLEGNLLMLELNEAKGGTATVLLQLENWMQFISLNHKVTVETKTPSLKFSSSTLKLSSIFTDVSDAAGAYLSHSNLKISSVEFTSAAKAGSAAWQEAAKLQLYFDPVSDQVIACIADPENTPRTGTYSFDAKATLPDGTVLKASKLKVSVNAAAPKVTLKNTTLKLNKVLCGYEIAATTATLTKGDGYQLVGFRLPEDWQEKDLPLDIDYADGRLTVFLLDADAAAKTHTVKLSPVVLHEASGQEAVLPSQITLRIQIYSSEKISVALSSKGKLDTVDPESQIRYTVTKITNACGSVTGVSLEGPDAQLFDACLNEDGTVSLKLLPGEVYSVKQTYKVQFRFAICGQDVSSAMLSFKVTQSPLMLKAKAAAVTMYQSQTAPVTFEVSLAEPVNAAIERIVLDDKSSQAFLEAMGDGEMDVTISEDGRTAIVAFEVRNAASLAFGKSYTLYLDAAAAGCAEDGKQNQIKLTVNVKK